MEESRKEAESVFVKDSDDRYRLLFEQNLSGIYMMDLATGRILECNLAFAGMIGYASQAEVIGRQIRDFLVRRQDYEPLRDRLLIEKSLANMETAFRKADGAGVWLLQNLVLLPETGEGRHVLGTVADITPRKNIEQQLLHNAFHDPLTGLANRALFYDRLGHAVQRARRRPGYLFAVVFLDMDRFKIVNDSLGHVVGDQILAAIGGRLTFGMRPADTVARLGGDEFALLLEDLQDFKDATRVASRLLESLYKPFQIQDREVYASASIGIALSQYVRHANSPGPTETTQLEIHAAVSGAPVEEENETHFTYLKPEEILRDAELAMYRAKNRGGARYEVFDKALHEHTVTLMQMETDLRKAILLHEFVPHYQPVIDLKTGRVSGFEALVRWKHPVKGLLPPAAFIQLAEENGFIIEIGRQVLRQSCKQLSEWQVQFPQEIPLTMSVNVSGKQLLVEEFIDQLDEALTESKIDPHSLHLEITETVIMKEIESVVATLFLLRSMGVHLDIDDFGTGYSSLTALHRFPIDTLKIDGSFVSGMTRSTENVEIVRTISRLAKNMDLRVLAEGVEEDYHLQQTRLLGCDYAQGYHMSRPGTAEAISELMLRAPIW